MGSQQPNFSTMLPDEDEIPGLGRLPFTNHDQLTADVARWLAEKVSHPERRTPSTELERRVFPVTASGIPFPNGSNTRYRPYLPAPGSAYPDEPHAVGSGEYSAFEDPAIEARRNADMWTERLLKGRRGLPGPIVVRSDGTDFEVGGEVQPEGDDDSSEPSETPTSR